MAITVFQPEYHLPGGAVINHPGNSFIKVLGLEHAGTANGIAAVVLERQGASPAGGSCSETELGTAVGAKSALLNQRRAQWARRRGQRVEQMMQEAKISHDLSLAQIIEEMVNATCVFGRAGHSGGMTTTKPPPLIDQTAHHLFRNKAASSFDTFDFLKIAVAERLADRLDIIRRDFPLALDIGCHTGGLASRLMETGKIGRIVGVDTSAEMVAQARARGVEAQVADYFNLPFPEASVDAIFSAFTLHWINDLPGLILRLCRHLKPDGLMMLALPGGETLQSLRNCFAEAESEMLGGMTPRVMPMADIRDLGGLLGRAGLALPVADSETITVTWATPFDLLRDLRGMGEQNALSARSRRFTPPSVIARMAELYAERFAGADHRIPASFEIITLTGWAPDANQPQPLKPGSATHNLADILTRDETGKERK